MSKIYVKEPKLFKESPEEFFNRLYGSDYGFPATYYDKRCYSEQCNRGAERSFSDLHRLMRTYYPRITHKKVMELIVKKCTGSIRHHLIYCPRVQKTVLYVGNWLTNDHKGFNETYFDYDRYLLKDKDKKIDKFTIYYLYRKVGYTTNEIKEELKKLN